MESKLGRVANQSLVWYKFSLSLQNFQSQISAYYLIYRIKLSNLPIFISLLYCVYDFSQLGCYKVHLGFNHVDLNLNLFFLGIHISLDSIHISLDRIYLGLNCLSLGVHFGNIGELWFKFFLYLIMSFRHFIFLSL